MTSAGKGASCDFLISDHGSIVILTALTEEAEIWVEDHLPEDRLTWGRSGTVIEPRYVGAILDGIANDGLTY